MQYCISDGILKHNCTKTFPLAGKQWELGFTILVIGRFFPCGYPINFILGLCRATLPGPARDYWCANHRIATQATQPIG